MNRVVFFCLFFLAGAFAQAGPEKIAVYVYGASDAGVNRSFGNSLLSAIAQSGKYADIEDWEAFYGELSNIPGVGISQISQAASRHGADVFCAVSMTEAFGAYSISARLVKISDSQVLKAANLNRSVSSLDELSVVSDELAARLLDLPLPAPAASQECKSAFNINELVFQIQSGFPNQLKDCSSTLAKNMALAASPFGKKTAQPEPKAFMMECAVGGMKQKLAAGAAEYIKPIESFVQNILNSASSAGGDLDVKKLTSAIGGMDVNGLLAELKAMALNDACAKDEPYTPLVSHGGEGGGGKDGREGDRPEPSDAHENFSVGQRWATWGVNMIVPGAGLGSIFVMSDWTGAIIQWVLVGGGYVMGFGVAASIERRCLEYENYCEGYSEGYGNVALFMLIAGGIYNIVRSVSYDKPRKVAYNQYEGFNFAVLPDKHGSFMPYLTYSKAF